MTSAREQLEKYQREFEALEPMPQEYYERMAERQLRKSRVFPPILEDPLDFVVFVQGLPLVRPEKLKSLMQKIVTSMVRQVTDTFKREQLLLNPEGGSCLLRFLEISEAKKFVALFDKSTEVFGTNYRISAQLFKQVDKQLHVPPPEQRTVNHVDLSDVFKHLLEEQVVSRFVLQNGTQNQFCSFNSCMGLIKEDPCEMPEFMFSTQGTFVIVANQHNIELRTEKQTFNFSIEVNQYDETAFKVSPCERFLAILYARKQNDKVLYRVDVFSIFEHYCIYASDEMEAFQAVPLKDQIGFSAFGDFMYLLDFSESRAYLFTTMSKSSNIYQISPISTVSCGALKQITFSPTGNLLGIFIEKSKIPSYFLLINPELDEFNQKVFTRNINITSAYFKFDAAGNFVTIIAETLQKQEISTMIVYIRIETNFPVKTVKLHAKSRVDAVEVSRDAIIYATGGKVFKIDEKQQEQMILNLPCNQLYYSQMTNILLCMDTSEKESKTPFKARVIFVDFEKAIPIMSFDGQFNSLYIDQYGRYLFALTTDMLMIYTISSQLIYKENCSGQNLIFRPEQVAEVSPAIELRELAQQKLDEYIADYIQMENKASAARNTSDYQKREMCAMQFGKIFDSPKAVAEQQAIREERLKRIRAGYPEYRQGETTEVKYEIKMKMGVSEVSTITKEQFEIVSKSAQK